MDHKLLIAIQHYIARYSVGGATNLDLSRFGVGDRDRFLIALNAAASELQAELPGREWGFARKGLNIFLRDCLYNAYLREQYNLYRAELFFEVALDSIVAGKIRERERSLPPWRNIKDLDYVTSELYQDAATRIARSEGFPRVHLDAVWWGRGESVQASASREASRL